MNKSNIVVEIVESMLFEKPDQLINIIMEMKHYGFKIAMDDFGVGYSSLHSLKNMPVDLVKIDRGFVKGINGDIFNATLIRSITELCHDVGKTVCLEGVEVGAEYEVVRDMGLELIQGYYYGNLYRHMNLRNSSFDKGSARSGGENTRIRRSSIFPPLASWFFVPIWIVLPAKWAIAIR